MATKHITPCVSLIFRKSQWIWGSQVSPIINAGHFSEGGPRLIGLSQFVTVQGTLKKSVKFIGAASVHYSDPLSKSCGHSKDISAKNVCWFWTFIGLDPPTKLQCYCMLIKKYLTATGNISVCITFEYPWYTIRKFNMVPLINWFSDGYHISLTLAMICCTRIIKLWTGVHHLMYRNT